MPVSVVGGQCRPAGGRDRDRDRRRSGGGRGAGLEIPAQDGADRGPERGKWSPERPGLAEAVHRKLGLGAESFGRKAKDRRKKAHRAELYPKVLIRPICGGCGSRWLECFGLGIAPRRSRDASSVARHQHAALRMSERQLLQVGGALEFLLDGGRHIDSPQPEASGNDGIDVLVEVVLDFHPASLAINQPRHGCGPGTRNLLPLSAVMQPRHHPESAGQSDFGCRGNTQGLRTRRRASGEETTPQSRRATAPPRSRKRRPGHGSACPQFEVSPRRCLGSLRCGIFQKQWPCPKFRTKSVRSQSRKRTGIQTPRAAVLRRNLPPPRPFRP